MNDTRHPRSKGIPGSVFGRARRLVGLGTGLIAREVGGRLGRRDASGVLQSRIKQAQQLVESLGELKGAAMKVGQMISLEFSDVLPPEVNEVLRKLHDDSSFMEPQQVRTVLRKELGAARLAQLEDLSDTPIAAASIGQVHRATVDGRPIVLKIQYPGVAESIDADLGVVRRLSHLYCQIAGKEYDLSGVFEEIRASLHEEVDYEAEAASAQRYAAQFAGDPRFAVPDVYPDFTTRRVLALSYESGERIGSWVSGQHAAEQVTRLGDLVLELLLEEFFVHRLVQTDPNYGNFLYRPDAGQVVLLDFGATRSYSDELVDQVRQLLKAAYSGRDEEILRLAHAFSLFDAREAEPVKETFVRLLRLVTFMFRPENQPFRFADPDYLRTVRETAMELVHSVQYSPPARHLIFLNRKFGGMYHLLKELGYTQDLTPFFERALGSEPKRD